MSNPQLNKSKSGIKWNCIKCVDDSNDEKIALQKLCKKALFVLEILNFFPSFPNFPDSKGQTEVE